MEQFDKRREQQVWQRVQGRSPAPQKQDFRGLHLMVLENQAAYRRLATVLTGRLRERVQGLLGETQEEAAVLRGLQWLATGSGLPVKQQSASSGPPDRVLQGCYHRTYRALGEYTARSAVAEFGAVFQVLSRQAQEQCVEIAALLGELGAGGRG